MRTRAIATCGLVLVAATCGDDRGDDAGNGEADYRPPHAQPEPRVAGYSAPPAAIAVEPMPAFQPPAPVWPAARAVALAANGSAVADPAMPLRVEDLGAGALGPVTVEPLSRAATLAAGIDGVVLRVSRAGGLAAAGPARITLDYHAFRWAHGGDWASRLALWVLPECALTSPGAAGCTGQRLAGVNDAGAGTVSAVLDAGTLDALVAPRDPTAGAAPVPTGMLVMAAAASAGAGGDYAATSLAPAAAWSAGGNAGDFAWTYPLRIPPSLGGPAPRIELAYSSGSVDGRMASTNNQASWVGEGFEWQLGSIERRYGGCAAGRTPP